MHPNESLIHQFYKAFQNADAEGMAACYHEEATFKDPAFGRLKGKQVGNMWRVLVERGQGQIEISFHNVEANDRAGRASWEAIYNFSQTGRKVHNKIEASFQFKEGKIIDHNDRFNFWKWSGMALGPVGWLLGFTPLVQNKVRKSCQILLKKYEEKQLKADS